MSDLNAPYDVSLDSVIQDYSMPGTEYIFIVGLGRTGSTLTRAILNSSDRVGIGGESHYLCDLPRLGFQTRRSVRQKIKKIGDLSSDEGVRRIVDTFFSQRDHHLNFWNLAEKPIGREEFLNQVLASDRTERALFDLALSVHAQGKPIRGDKTPAHIFFVPQLLEWFPGAKIIHTFRDPRAIYSSRKKKSQKKGLPTFNAGLRRFGAGFELLSSLHVIVNWKRVIHYHDQYRARFPERYTLLKYEDLVCNPERTLHNLCAFLDIELTPKMFEQTVVNSSYFPDGAIGFDAASTDRWREHMDPVLKRWFSIWCRGDFERFGYAA